VNFAADWRVASQLLDFNPNQLTEEFPVNLQLIQAISRLISTDWIAIPVFGDLLLICFSLFVLVDISISDCRSLSLSLGNFYVF